MLSLIIILIIIGIVIWIYRFYFFSFLIYLSVRFERRPKDFQLLSSLRESLIHERKKKIAGLEMMLSSWERGDEVQPRYEYFEELLDQLKNLVHEERRNLMAVTRDIFLWGKLWHMLRRVEKMSKEKRERVEVRELRTELSQIQNLIEQVVEGATEQFSFTLNQVVAESVKIVRIEKSHLKNIEIQEHLDEAGDTIRFSYDKFKDWQRILTNLIRNAIEAVEIKQRVEGVAADFSLRGGEETGVADFSLPGGAEEYWVKVSTKETVSVSPSVSVPVSVCIEDSGIGMDEITRSSFYKKGFTYGKEGGLGLGVSEESVQLINQYGNWQIESQKGVGTKITINIDREKARKAELILPEPKPFFRTKLAWGLSVLVLALIGLSLLFIFDKYSRFWKDWNPAYAEAEEKRLLVYNKTHKLLWDVFLSASISLTEHDKEPIIRISDLDSDGKTEVLVGIKYDEKNTGKIICFDYKKEKLWEFSCGEDSVYQIGMEFNSKYFFPIAMETEDLDGDSKKEVIVTSGEMWWFPDQVAELDYKGNKISEYWHPGRLNCLYCLDFDNDGEKEVILGGINNRMDWRPVISVLDPDRVFGQAMPYLATKKIEKAKEKWYIVFPNIKKSLPDGAKWESFLSSVSGCQIRAKENRIDANLTDGRIYFLKRKMEYDYAYLYSSGFSSWKKGFSFPYDITKEDEENWKNIEVWKEGVKVR